MAPPAGLFNDIRVRPPPRDADLAPNFPPFDAPSVIPVSDTEPMINGQEEEFIEEPERITRMVTKKTTLGGYTVIREIDDDESSDDDSDWESDDSEVKKKLSTMNALCADALIDNEMASAMAGTKVVTHNASSHSTPLQYVLYRSYGSEHSDPGSNSEAGGVSNRISNIPSPSTQQARVSRVSNGAKKKGRRRSSQERRQSYESGGSLKDDSIRTVFGPGAAAQLKPHHAALNRVVETIFGLDRVSMDIKMKTFSEQSQDLKKSRTSLKKISGSLKQTLKQLRKVLLSYVTCSPFTIFFMCLTLYVMFGPDILLMLGNRETEPLFLTLHTFIFSLFCLEFCLLACGVENYLFSVGAALDLIAAFSLLNDTWIFHNTSLEGSIVLHQSRITRLTRVARVARVTRLVPRIMELFRRHRKTYLAKRFLMRRLRRAFLYLDVDRDGLLSSFDVKCLYLTILQGCSPMLLHGKNALLKSDAMLLMQAAPGGNLGAENESNLSFQEFERVFFATTLGQDVLLYHLKELQNSNGVWALTASISDHMALKICVGLLVLIVMMKLVEHETGIPDVSAEQGLLTLYSMSYHAKTSGMYTGFTSDMCQWIASYQEDLKVLFLYMDGIAWVDYGSSACPSLFNGEPFERIDEIMKLANMRSSEVAQACLPPFEDRSCPKDLNIAVALVDEKDELWNDGFFSFLATVSVMIIIAVLIIAFSNGINTFTHNTLNPTRALVDDMMAISSLELVHIDAEMPEAMAKEYTETPVEELSKLQTSFKAMRSAIRSWSSYVPPSVVEKLFNAGVEATIGVSRTLATILFIDIEGFEEACNGMEPNDVNRFLASVFEKLAVIISNNRGTLLEFIADEVLAVYNTPNVVRSHVFAAVNSAIEIHKSIATLPKLATKDGRLIQIRCRCGVHTAKILAGNIGSHRRMKYGLLGDGVNLTARLKNLNSKYNTQTVASKQVCDDALSAKRVTFRILDRVAVKGKTEPTTVYEVMEFQKGTENSQKMREAAQKHNDAFAHYLARNFVEARALFSEVATTLEPLKTRCRLSASELDQPSRQMKKRCTMYIKNPPGDAWDGVEHLKAKTFEIAGDYDEDEDIFDHIVPSESKLKLDKLDSVVGSTPRDMPAVTIDPVQSSDLVEEEKHDNESLTEIYDTYSAVDVGSGSLCSCSPSNNNFFAAASCPFWGESTVRGPSGATQIVDLRCNRICEQR